VLRAEKAQIVDDLRGIFADAGVVVVTHYMGLNVAELQALRVQMREADARFRVTKNSLAKLAIDGTSFAPIADLLTGPTAIAYSADPVAAPKVISAFAKKNEKLVIVGGSYAGTLLDADKVRALAEMPSLDELRAKLLSLINTPASRLVGLLQAPGGQLARVLKAKADLG
jgi:large subunit ribosomal protein L10